MALDGLIDRGARTVGRPRESSVTTPTLDASVNWDVPGAYASPVRRRTVPTTCGSGDADGAYRRRRRHQQHRVRRRDAAADDAGAMDGRRESARPSPATRRWPPGRGTTETRRSSARSPCRRGSGREAEVQRLLERGARPGTTPSCRSRPTAGRPTTSLACTDTAIATTTRTRFPGVLDNAPGLHRVLGRLAAAGVQPRGVRRARPCCSRFARSTIPPFSATRSRAWHPGSGSTTSWSARRS